MGRNRWNWRLRIGRLMATKAEDILIILLIIVSVRVVAHGRKKRENRVHYIDACPGENLLLILVIDLKLPT